MSIAHEALGARMGEVGGRAVPRHYGDPAGEYEAAHRGAIVVDRADRVVLRVTGRDPARMLHGLLTNDLAGAPEGTAVYGAFLTPKGRMVAEGRLARQGSVVLVETAAGAEAALREHFRKYLPPLFARVEESSGLAVLGVYGPRATAALGNVADGASGAVLLPPLELPEGDGADLVLPAAAVDDFWRRLVAGGVRPAGHGTLEVLRIEAGRPRWGAELDDTVIPLEAGLKERAISTSKGCYTGQEVIIRILHRGHVNRLLRGLLLGDAPDPARGATLTLPGQEKAVGTVTSACASPALGQTIALGYVRRAVEPGATVLVEGREARVVALPFST